MLTVTNDHGRMFGVRVIRKGDRYGREDCLTHDDAHGYGPMVEWHDMTGNRVQFVSRYYLSTLLDDERRLVVTGLDLDGGVPVWKMSGQNVADALTYARDQTAGYVANVCTVCGGHMFGAHYHETDPADVIYVECDRCTRQTIIVSRAEWNALPGSEDYEIDDDGAVMLRCTAWPAEWRARRTI